MFRANNKKIIAAVLAFMVVPPLLHAPAVVAQQPVKPQPNKSLPPGTVILFCFTSQTCPNCPPAKDVWIEAARRIGNAAAVSNSTPTAKFFFFESERNPVQFDQWRVGAVPTTISAVMQADGTAMPVGRIDGIPKQMDIERLISEARVSFAAGMAGTGGGK